MIGEAQSLEKGLRLLFQEAGLPLVIGAEGPWYFNGWGGSSSKKAVEIAKKVITDIRPGIDFKNLYKSDGHTYVKKTA